VSIETLNCKVNLRIKILSRKHWCCPLLSLFHKTLVLPTALAVPQNKSYFCQSGTKYENCKKIYGPARNKLFSKATTLCHSLTLSLLTMFIKSGWFNDDNSNDKVKKGMK
jgi:hypothetical protein